MEHKALRLCGLPEASPAVLYACPAAPVGTRSLALETTWDLPSLTAGATANIDVTVPGARRGHCADASLDTSSIACCSTGMQNRHPTLEDGNHNATVVPRPGWLSICSAPPD